MTPFLAELIGTFILILLGDGVVALCLLDKSKGLDLKSNWMVITTGWALAVFAGVIVAGPYSGAHLNPAVTIGLAAAGLFPWSHVLLYIVAQLIGAMLGALVVWIMYVDHFKATNNDRFKLVIFCTDPEIYNPKINIISEIVGTFVLIYLVLFIKVPDFGLGAVPHGTFPVGLASLGAIPVAFIVWAIGLSLGGTTGYAINPARDLGPRIIHQILPIPGTTHWAYAWVPIVGPIIGCLLAAGLYLAFH